MNGKEKEKMKSKFGSKALSLLLSLTMVLSMVPAMTLPASAAVLPSDANTPGKGYYPNASWDTTGFGTEEAPTASDYGTHAYWEKIAPKHQHTTLHDGQILSDGTYYIILYKRKPNADRLPRHQRPEDQRRCHADPGGRRDADRYRRRGQGWR